MTSFLLFILDVILGGIAYFLYIAIFIPAMKKNEFYAKLKAKQRAELDDRIGLQEYFAVKTENEIEKKK